MADTPGPIPCAGVQTQEWHAWIDTMPPGPNTLIVIGEAQVPNPGVEGILVPTNPQGINPQILMLDVLFHQRPGAWPQVMTWIPLRYERRASGPTAYTEVTVMCEGNPIVQIPVQVVS